LDEGDSASKMETEMLPTQASVVDINKKRRGRPKKRVLPTSLTTNNRRHHHEEISQTSSLEGMSPLNKFELDQTETKEKEQNILLCSKKITKRKRCAK